jgi:hypothetical protein
MLPLVLLDPQAQISDIHPGGSLELPTVVGFISNYNSFEWLLFLSVLFVTVTE